MIATLARKSLSARKGRNAFVFIVIGFVVAFVVGSFVLTDSLGSTFTSFINDNVDASSTDLIVRSRVEGDNQDTPRDPVPAEMVDKVEQVPGVDYAHGDFFRYVLLVFDREVKKQDGTVEVVEVKLGTNGPPIFGTVYSDEYLEGATLDGAPPSGSNEIVIDSATSESQDLNIRDTVTLAADGGTFEMTIVGTVRPDAQSFASAGVVLLDQASAPEVLGATGEFDSVTVNVEAGADVDEVAAAVAETLPPNLEVLTGEQLTDEIQQQLTDQIDTIFGFFRTGLLIFAGISAFVGAFIINNMFAISVGQRLRELALLRAVGASRRQVLRLVLGEAALISVIATAAGILGGIAVAWGLTRLLGALVDDFPSISTVVGVRALLAAVAVGVGVVLASAAIPAIRAARIPPVAAMRPEIGFQALSASRRLIGGIVLTAIGIGAFLFGLFGSVGGGRNVAILVGGGALVSFIGITSLSTTVANPVSRFLGWPIAKLFKTPGALARDNSARSPRRTARTASALMIGVAIISAAAMFASSLQSSLNDTLDRSIASDFAITPLLQEGFPSLVADAVAAVPGVETVSTERRFPVELTAPDMTDDLQIVAIDPSTYDSVVKLDPVEGSYEAMETEQGIGVFRGAAEDAGVGLGDSVDIQFNNGEVRTVPVSMIFDDGGLGDFWFMPDSLASDATSAPVNISVMWVKTAEDADADTMRSAIEDALADYPQAEVQSNADFKEFLTTGITIMQIVINVLLSGAVLLSFVSIAVTLALSVIERTREIGLLRAVGMTRRQLRRTIRWEAVIVTVFGVTIGLAMGLAIGFALLKALPDDFITIISPPYLTITFVVILAIIAALIAALYPAIKASRMNVLDAISAD